MQFSLVDYSHEVSSDDNNKVLASGFPGAGLQSSFAGFAENVQSMVKDPHAAESEGRHALDFGITMVSSHVPARALMLVLSWAGSCGS